MASVLPRNGKYCVIYDHYDSTGKRKQIWETYATQPEAELRKAEIEYKKRKGSLIVPTSKTVKDFVAEWTELCGPEWAPKTRATIRTLVNNHIVPMIGNKVITDVTPKDIERLKNDLILQPCSNNSAKPISKTTQHHVIKLLHQIFCKAAEWHDIESNPVTCKIPARSRQTRTAWDDDEIHFAMTEINNPILHLAVHIALQCSLRVGEIMAIQVGDIDIDKMQIVINKSMQRVNIADIEHASAEEIYLVYPTDKQTAKSVLIHKPTKTQNSDRIVYYGPILQEELRTRLAVIDTQRELLGSDYKHHNLLFCDDVGNPIEPNQISKMFRRWVNDNVSAIRKICFHELRHTSATKKAEIYNPDLEVIRADTGQTREILTRTYLHESETHRRALALQMEKKINI